MLRRVGVFVAAYVVWVILVFPHDPARAKATPPLPPWDVQSLLLGLGVALLVALVIPTHLTREPMKLLNPVRWFWAAVYLPVLLYHIIRANLQVAYIVLHPDLPISPGTVRIKTSLRSSSARSALANSITLTPGTLTVDIDDGSGSDEASLYVHCLVLGATDVEAATREIAGKFEPLLKRIFD
jgi:multicomponent Na+:H+ antiporter subunit E